MLQNLYINDILTKIYNFTEPLYGYNNTNLLNSIEIKLTIQPIIIILLPCLVLILEYFLNKYLEKELKKELLNYIDTNIQNLLNNKTDISKFEMNSVYEINSNSSENEIQLHKKRKIKNYKKRMLTRGDSNNKKEKNIDTITKKPNFNTYLKEQTNLIIDNYPNLTENEIYNHAKLNYSKGYCYLSN